MRSVGLVGAGAMGTALGAGWRAGGLDVRTCVSGRSERTVQLVTDAGLDTVASLDEVVGCDVVVSVVPPAQAVPVARDIAAAARRTGARPLVVDLNAVAPSTLASIERELAAAGLMLVDGSISGGPPSAARPTRVYVCGPDAGAFVTLPSPWLDVVTLPGELGTASALKMCTASMYKGSTALITQAMLTARHHGVLDEFLADVSRQWPEEVPGWPGDVALAATKSGRFVDEMHEIARTQRGAGAAGALFDGVAAAYARIARTRLGQRAPESVRGAQPVDEVLAQLTTARPAAVLFDFSSTLFYIEDAEQALLGALGPDFVDRADAMRQWGAINGSSTPDVVPPELQRVWAERDLCADDHRAAYAGLSRHAGLTRQQSDALYARGISAAAWTPYAETLPMLRTLRGLGIPVAMVSNIGWDPRPVLELYGADRDIDVVVLSYERGVEKPDPAIFEMACNELDVRPDAAVMIGDNPVADGGATALGMPFVLVPADASERSGDEFARAIGLPPVVRASRGA